MLKKTFLISTLFTVLTACAETPLVHLEPINQQPANTDLQTEAPANTGIACSDPRPQMCTMDYTPVCGNHKDGSSKTYGNACGACSNPEVVGHLLGECPE